MVERTSELSARPVKLVRRDTSSCGHWRALCSHRRAQGGALSKACWRFSDVCWRRKEVAARSLPTSRSGVFRFIIKRPV